MSKRWAGENLGHGLGDLGVGDGLRTRDIELLLSLNRRRQDFSGDGGNIGSIDKTGFGVASRDEQVVALTDVFSVRGAQILHEEAGPNKRVWEAE